MTGGSAHLLASIATQNTGGAQLGVLSSANPVVPVVPSVLGVSSPEPESSVPVVVDLAAQTTGTDSVENGESISRVRGQRP